MKSNREMCAEAREMLKSGWSGRVMAVMVSLYALTLFATSLVAAVYKDRNIQTWWDFLAEKARLGRMGLDFTVPSSSIAWSMTGATAFLQLVSFLFTALLLYGVTMVFLKAVRNDENRWFADSFGGYSRPLQLFYLIFVIHVRMFLWSLLLIVPGVVAYYKYRLAWYLKCEHPDFGAEECISRSVKMMEGHKLQLFMLDLHYFIPIFLLVAGVVVLNKLLFQAQSAFPAVFGLAGAVLSFLALWLELTLVVRYFAARTVFYRELAALQPQDVGDDLPGDDI